ncbi:MAG TPA: hypothetical protein VKU83_05760, partial [Puia sp.]|nr:hypothetical protein [Puia sp.]
MKKIYLLTAGFCVSMTLFAQSPGGVSAGLSLWLKADAASTLHLTGSNVNSWDYVNAAKSFSFTGGTNAVVVNSAINGLPAVFFNGNTEMDGPTGANAPLPAGSVAYSVFAVWSSAITGTSGGPYQRVWTQWGNNGIDGNGTSVWLYNGEWGDQPEISVGGFITGEGNPYSTNTYYITEMNLLNQASNDLELTDNTDFATGPNVLSTEAGSGNTVRANLSTNINSLGYRVGSPAGEFFDGNLSELIVYTNPVSAGASKNEIFSYLSMKYGIPIGTNLVSSSNTTVWDATAHAAYNNDVFGLAYDLGSGLNIQSSNPSTTAGVSGAGNIVLTPSDVYFMDQLFMMVGHDNGSLSTEESTNMPAYAS